MNKRSILLLPSTFQLFMLSARLEINVEPQFAQTVNSKNDSSFCPSHTLAPLDRWILLSILCWPPLAFNFQATAAELLFLTFNGWVPRTQPNTKLLPGKWGKCKYNDHSNGNFIQLFYQFFFQKFVFQKKNNYLAVFFILADKKFLIRFKYFFPTLLAILFQLEGFKRKSSNDCHGCSRWMINDSIIFLSTGNASFSTLYSFGSFFLCWVNPKSGAYFSGKFSRKSDGTKNGKGGVHCSWMFGEIN